MIKITSFSGLVREKESRWRASLERRERIAFEVWACAEV